MFAVKIRQFLFIVHLIILGFSKSQKPVILVSFDGMRHDYLEKADTPNFDAFIKTGVKAESLIPVFPSYTFPNHYSIATGTYPGYHMISGNKFFDKKLKKEYSLYDRSTVEDSKFYKGEPIWVTAEKQGIKTASFFWVGSEAPVNGIHPSIFKNYDGSIPFDARVDSVVSWLLLPEELKPELVLLYFHEPDKSGHIHGPNSQQTIEAIQEADRVFGKLLHELEKKKLQPNILVVSDHGMKTIDRNKVIIIDDYIENLDSLTVYGNGPLMQIDFNYKSRKMVQNSLKKLKKIPNTTGYSKQEFPKIYHFINRNSGDFILVPNPGWLLFTQEQLKESNMLNNELSGMHGWIPEDEDMHGIFFAAGPQIRKNVNVDSFENIAVYGIISTLLQITPYSSKQFSDGAIMNDEIIRQVINQ
tara:strand:- start:948 stop:2192 length:1245 start_codon:yes stop_codon:yes gene_type:complete